MATPEPAKVLADFFRLHDGIAAIIVRADDFRLREINITSPVHPRLRPSFFAYLQGATTHEQCHWNQAEALMALPGFPK